MATITPVFAAMIIRIIWELIADPSVGGLVMSLLVILGLLGLYTLILYFILKPNLKILKGRPVRIGFAAMATGGFIGGIIHFSRFVPSPEASEPLSIVIAALYLLAGTSAYFLLLWIIWSTWEKRKNQD
ncbi:hypothetical protein ACFLW4_04675 [Chloroflexota bacterium]